MVVSVIKKCGKLGAGATRIAPDDSGMMQNHLAPVNINEALREIDNLLSKSVNKT